MSTIVTRVYEPCHKVTAACDGKATQQFVWTRVRRRLPTRPAPIVKRSLSFPAGDTYPAPNNARLLARRDLPRPHAELVDVPVADDHLDGG